MKKCWKCAEEIQDEAIACRFCNANQNSLDRDRFKPESGPSAQPKRKSMLPFLLSVVAILVVVIALTNTSEPRSWQNGLSPERVGDVIEAFETNEVRASELYRRPIELHGIVESIDAGITGDNLYLTGEDAARSIGLSLISGQDAAIRALSVGQPAVAQCASLIEVLSVITAQDCLVRAGP